jgi:hypothetical protein
MPDPEWRVRTTEICIGEAQGGDVEKSLAGMTFAASAGFVPGER